MKTFEEKWTAWLDGQLGGKELIEFEASIQDKAAAEAEKRDVQKLGALLKKELGAQVLQNEEFFSHQLHERIEYAAAAQGRPDGGARWWNVPRLVWAGATSLAIFAVFTFFVMREKAPDKPSPYLTQILNARVDPVVSPNATTAVFETKKDKVTVLWVEGLQSLPADYAAK
jgi:hypothetical protein